MHYMRSARLTLAGACATATIVALSGVAIAGNGDHKPHGAGARQQARNVSIPSFGGTPDGDLMDQQAQFDNMRNAPAATVSGEALLSAAQDAARLPRSGGAWQEVTTLPYNGEPNGYTDPNWSNLGAGFSIVGGRVTALAQTPDGAWYAGGADGGVWKSTDQGQQWAPLFDSMPSLSIGALAVNPVDHSLWVGTGEANVSQDSYFATGVYRTGDGGTTFQVVGPNSSGNSPLTSRTTFRLAFDSAGNAYAATDNGLFRYSAGTGTWTEVLDPAGPVDNPPYDQQVTDVAVVPGSGGADVIAAIGWHGPGSTAFNGFYESTNSGASFAGVTLNGAILATDIGRTTFAYSADGTKLYAIVQSPTFLATGRNSVLQGIFVSTGSPAKVAGPWTKIADKTKLLNSGSAAPTFGALPGVQAWYNQDLAVDPANPNHLYAGLEEVFESTDGGTTWITASPYWNYKFACDATLSCPLTTHPDQHAMMIANGKIVIGNDGGVYSRPLSDALPDGNWSDLNATLRNLQYYDARAGKLGGHGVGVWGGLQDNGDSLITTGSSQMVEPAGGDGFDVIVDPQKAERFAGEYVDGAMYITTDGGHTFSNFVSPTCEAERLFNLPDRTGCDAAARFVTPLTMDLQNKNVWLIGGEFVWVSKAGWQSTCAPDNSTCTWQNVFDTGTGNAVTALSSANGGQIIYAAFVGGGGNPGSAFGRGIATNFGGTWHTVNTAGLPNRFIAGITVDEHNPAHAYAIFNGYSRRFVPGGGVGHVFETMDGGQTWNDISGNLPDIASDALLISKGKLALATDAGMFTAAAGQGSATSWSRLGTGLPNAVVDDVTEGPDGNIYAATHGRGIWRIQF
jgi:hypothetical protein